MGRLRRKQGTDETIQNYSNIVMTAEEAISCRGMWGTRFTTQGRVVLELGAGKGRFLIESAKMCSEYNYIGMERQAGVLVHALKKAADEKIPNLLFIWADGIYLAECFAVGELYALHINFCDPWPKLRHAKRRLTHPHFLRRYREVLSPEGCLHLKTDNVELFEYSLEQFVSAGMELLQVSRDLHGLNSCCSMALTEYEEKFKGMSVPIHYCRARFTSAVVEDNA